MQIPKSSFGTARKIVRSVFEQLQCYYSYNLRRKITYYNKTNTNTTFFGGHCPGVPESIYSYEWVSENQGLILEREPEKCLQHPWKAAGTRLTLLVWLYSFPVWLYSFQTWGHIHVTVFEIQIQILHKQEIQIQILLFLVYMKCKYMYNSKYSLSLN